MWQNIVDRTAVKVSKYSFYNLALIYSGVLINIIIKNDHDMKIMEYIGFITDTQPVKYVVISKMGLICVYKYYSYYSITTFTALLYFYTN